MFSKLLLLSAVLGAAVAASVEPVAIIAKHVDIHPDGSYEYSYETADGIRAQSVGELRQVDKEHVGVAHGDFSWTAPEGDQISIQYVADENGYQPVGEHIPQPPPIPHQIQKALDYLATLPPTKEEPQHHHKGKGKFH